MTKTAKRNITLFSFAIIDPGLVDGLKFVKERDGIGISEQIRRACKTWLAEKEVTKRDLRRWRQRQKAERRRAATRKRP